MKNDKYLFLSQLISISIITCFFSCTNSQSKNKSIKYPNKDSELALLMRDIVDDTENVKKQIKDNKEIKFFVDFEKLYTAIPTDEELRNDSRYNLYTELYINSIQELLETQQNKTEFYNNMVQVCINCHNEVACPGPVKRIRKLYIR